MVAYQCGSLIIAAAWLDLKSDLSACQIFEAQFGEGQIYGNSNEEAEVEAGHEDAPRNFQLYTASDKNVVELVAGACSGVSPEFYRPALNISFSQYCDLRLTAASSPLKRRAWINSTTILGTHASPAPEAYRGPSPLLYRVCQ